MTHIQTAIFIDKSPDIVFDFVTVPHNWPQWHPSSIQVVGSSDHSLDIGEQVTEDYQVAGRKGRVVWTARERERPSRWVIEGQTEDGGRGTITYTLSADGAGTRFTREFVYDMPNPFLAMLNWLILRHRIRAESARALTQLKQVLELPSPKA
ncbi:MAG: SRPBCC family protein [Cyanobacteria bacterium P01_E01_bin.6]